MKKYVFFCNKQIPGVSPSKEIVEFDNDSTEEEIQQCFTEWVFDKLDTGYWEVGLESQEKEGC